MLTKWPLLTQADEPRRHLRFVQEPYGLLFTTKVTKSTKGKRKSRVERWLAGVIDD
jgi:hypothetical protein